jgi:hypothetical protein
MGISDRELQSFINDAMRYRWLRDTNSADFRGWWNFGENVCAGMIDCIMMYDSEDSSTGLSPEEMDNAIDVAMKRWPFDDTQTAEKA